MINVESDDGRENLDPFHADGLLAGTRKQLDVSAINVTSRSLHELAPYIGKMRPELAAWAIEQVSSPGDAVLDPFCGSGTVLLEGLSRGRRVVGLDLNPYAWLISSAKLLIGSPPAAGSVRSRLESYSRDVESAKSLVDLRRHDRWIRSFYHPETLRELIAWSWVLRRAEDAFSLACLMAIAHHQRPGFLSYPASHTVPYLRTAKFPRTDFAEMYSYRAVMPRLERKMLRALKDAHSIPLAAPREVHLASACDPPPFLGPFDAVITSPPYMGQLHYARDNRLRLALLGKADWVTLDRTVSPNFGQFSLLIVRSFEAWRRVVRKGGRVAILVGDTTNTVKQRFDRFVARTVELQVPEFRLVEVLESAIPDDRRARKNCRGSSAEMLLVFQKD